MAGAAPGLARRRRDDRRAAIPFGLALANAARRAGIRVLVVGRSVSFWTDHMPRGMFLRSGPDWHLDTAGVRTMETFLAERGATAREAMPIPRDLYLEYVEWFRRGSGIDPVATTIVRLDRGERGALRFLATCADGDTIAADCVALAIGFDYSRNVSAALTHERSRSLERAPPHSYRHLAGR